MQAEIITIGDELLIGQVVDTNAAWLASQLDRVGFYVRQIKSVPDDLSEIRQALSEAAGSAHLVLMTGGLGPTKDDITKKALSEHFSMPLKSDPDVLQNVREVIANKLGKMNGLNEQQALVPEGARIIQNPIGTAPVIWVQQGNTVFISLPGVPFEMKYLITEKIMPVIEAHFHTPATVRKTVLTTGIPEAMLAEKLEPWENQLPDNISLAYLPSPGRIRLRLSARGDDRNQLQELIDNHIKQLFLYIPEAIFGSGEETLEQVVGKMLTDGNLSVSTAESCTGGNISRLIASVPGASEYFRGGTVAYSNQVKMQDLGVTSGQLEMHGAVSREVVECMAMGALKKFGADFSVAISGVAGPSGGTAEKPVGTVWIAIGMHERVIARRYGFGDKRERNIVRASATALNLLRLQLLDYLDIDTQTAFWQRHPEIIP